MNKEKKRISTTSHKKQRVLVTGAKGMLGQELARQFSKPLTTGYQLFLTDKEELDITDKKTVREVVEKIHPDYIIHTAAYTEVDKAEDEKALCRKINVTGTANIARAAGKIGATVIYISTDYVFDGKKNKPYKETDKANPLGIYAKTKLQGEELIAKHCKKHYIIRAAWLFGRVKGKQNFVEKMITLSKRGPLRVIDDQIGSPTSTKDLADTIGLLIARHSAPDTATPYGIYHLSGVGETTRYGFAKEIFRQLKIKANLTPVKTTEFFAKAERPAYSYLDKTKIGKALNVKIRPWQKMLADYLKNR